MGVSRRIHETGQTVNKLTFQESVETNPLSSELDKKFVNINRTSQLTLNLMTLKRYGLFLIAWYSHVYEKGAKVHGESALAV